MGVVRLSVNRIETVIFAIHRVKRSIVLNNQNITHGIVDFKLLNIVAKRQGIIFAQ